MSDSEEMFLIEKRGLYYRPNAQGYTGRKADAGRYTFEEAASRAGPNGPDGSQDGMGIWRESEAPEHSTSCPWDVKMKDAAFKDGYDAARSDLEAQLAQRDAALKAADELYDAIRDCQCNGGIAESILGYCPAKRLDAAQDAYDKARGQDAD